jgi:hypothetical protein
MPKYTIINGQMYEIPDDTLMHYGVPGMKWGVRRGGNASRASRYLNKVDRRRAESMSSYIRSDIKSRQFAAKITKAKAKGSKSVDKLVYKKTVADKQKKQHLADVKSAEAETKKLINKLSKDNYTVNSKEVIRCTKFGEQYAARYLGGFVASAALHTTAIKNAGDRYKTTYRNDKTLYQNEYQVKGNRYKVR